MQNENPTSKIKCTILPNNKRLAQIIKEFGEEWSAISPIKHVPCFDNGLGVKVQSLCEDHIRWVRYPDDIRF